MDMYPCFRSLYEQLKRLINENKPNKRIIIILPFSMN